MSDKKKSKVIIITGASKGIGRASAELFANRGHRVYGLSRSEPQGEYNFAFLRCDVTDYPSVEAAFKSIFEKEGSIDCVVNNAGFGIAGAVEETTDEAAEKILSVDFCAVEKICRIALPYLRKSKGRIVNLSSVAAIMPIAFQAYYSAVKSAVYVFSRALDQEVRPFGVRVVAVLPGDTKTDFTASRETAVYKGDYEKRAKRSVSRMEKDEQNGAPPEKVAKTILKAFYKKRPKTRYIVGFSYKLIALLDRLLPTRLVDHILFKLYAK